VPSWDPPGDALAHYGLLVFRAIENRLTIIKADSAYDSAIIDPYGRILASAVTPRGARATLLARVPAGTGHTPQVRFGNLGGWITVSAALASLAVGPWRSQRSPACGR
jgi:apolipoprotein N-acyltransferase